MAEDMAKERLVYRACQWTMGGEDKETPPPSQGADKAGPPRSPTYPIRAIRIGRRHEVPAF